MPACVCVSVYVYTAPQSARANTVTMARPWNVVGGWELADIRSFRGPFCGSSRNDIQPCGVLQPPCVFKPIHSMNIQKLVSNVIIICFDSYCGLTCENESYHIRCIFQPNDRVGFLFRFTRSKLEEHIQIV